MEQTVNKNPVLPRHPANAANNDFIYMTLPLIAIAAYLYGARPVGLCAVALLTANLCDRLVAVLRRRFYDKTENSSLAFALIVTLLMPASVPYYVLVITVIITVVLGKAVFGGYGVYPFVPPALGFAAAALSWPDLVLRYPEPFAPLTLFSTEGVVLEQSASHTLAAGGLPNINLFNLLLGNYPGSMGTTAGVVIIACAAYLWMRKRITLAAPLGFLGACVAIAYVFPRLGGIGLAWPWEFMRFRLLIVTYEILSGALLYVAVFLLNDETTLPKRQDARLIYGIVAGITAMVFRYYGSFDMGACFALLWVNVLSGPLDRWMGALEQHRKGHRVTVKVTAPQNDKTALLSPEGAQDKTATHGKKKDEREKRKDKAAKKSGAAKQPQNPEKSSGSKQEKALQKAPDASQKKAAEGDGKDAFGQDAAPVSAVMHAPTAEPTVQASQADKAAQRGHAVQGNLPSNEADTARAASAASAPTASSAPIASAASTASSAQHASAAGTSPAKAAATAGATVTSSATETSSAPATPAAQHPHAEAAQLYADTTITQAAQAHADDVPEAKQPVPEQQPPVTRTQPIAWAAFKYQNNPKRDADGKKVDS